MFTFIKIFLLYCVIFASFSHCRSVENFKEQPDEAAVNYYENLINHELEKALNYELATDATIHQPDDNIIREFGTFDFIVIGAGSTGSVIASRLSEISKWKVLLLEAGKYPNNFTMIPGFFAIQAMTEYNWGFLSTPQKTACLGAKNNQCVIPRGKGIGGTSLINQLIYSRGNPVDYNKWAKLLNDNSWKYENILQYFKKSEDFHKTNPEAPVDLPYHGIGGNWYNNFHIPSSEFSQIFLKANQELGKNITDYNGKEQLGATILQMNTKEGRRFDQASAFITPIKDRTNLHISIESYVIKIEIDSNTKQATGVLFTKDKKLYRANISKEIILSAGTISSPHLLMLSGIGPKNHLIRKGIPVVKNLEVGSKLRDHVFFTLDFSSNVSKSDYTTVKTKIKEYLQGYGDFTAGNPIDAAGWYKTSFKNTYPDIEIIPTSSIPSELGRRFLQIKEDTWYQLHNKSIPNPFSLTIILLHPKSTGTVRLDTKNPYFYPIIDTNALSDPEYKDKDKLLEGIELALNLTKTPAFQQIGAKHDIKTLKACSRYKSITKDYWYCQLNQLATPAFHPVGTCPSGLDPKKGAVVDGNLNVHGVGKIRVIDASVIPFTFSGHPNAICTMIAEKLVDVIKFEHQD